jgi:hypothetical protein
MWDRGWVKVQRITATDFHYLLKYVTKPDELPAWVLKRKRLRVFQSTKGFLKPVPPQPTTISLKEPCKRASYTMDERFWRWACMGVLRQNDLSSKKWMGLTGDLLVGSLIELVFKFHR